MTHAFDGWTGAELTDAITRIERTLQPDLIHMLSDRSIASETLRLGRLRREVTRRWVAERKASR